MECPGWWAIVVISYLSFQDVAVFGQNVVPGGPSGNRPCGNPSSTDLLNSILTAAASNGVLPDLIPMLQGQPPFTQDLATPLSVVPMPFPGFLNSPDPNMYSNQGVRPPENQNVIYATAVPSGPGFTNTISNVPQTITLPPLPPTNCVQQIAQAVPLENYPTCAQNVGAVRPMPIALQPQCQFNEVNPYSVYNQIESISQPDVNTQPLNLPILPPPQVLPTINSFSGSLEITRNLGLPCLPQPTVTSDGQLPLNLQINMPTPTAPKITVVSANPANNPIPGPGPLYSDPANLPPFQYPSQPPIVVGGGSRSSLRSMLPILLLALLSDRGCNKCDGCCCCCSCNSSNSGNNIPIPYPVPIPINNPVVNTYPYPYSSRNREHRDDGDDDEDKKKK